MKLTFLGHASWLVQSSTTTIVCDLLIENSFRNGTFTICPTRELDFSLMPKLDALIISHSHRDHFDLETLLQLDRSTKILCPKDPIILHALDRLGFRRVEQFADWTCHQVGDLDIVFTPSDNRVPENGFLVTDGEATFWNHVDTIINSNTLGRIREKIGVVDLVAHGYQAMLETAALDSLGAQFPASGYSSILHRARHLAPRALVPGSNGYRTAGHQAWFNAYKFPVSRERFVRDIRRVLPDTQVFIPNPGDVMEIDGQGMKTARQAAAGQFVRSPVDDAAELMEFDPSGVKPELVDDNPLGIEDAELRAMTRTVFESRIPQGLKIKLPAMHPLRMIEALVEIRVVYPDRTMQSWVIDLSGAEPRVTLGTKRDDTDIVMSVNASGLHGIAMGTTRPDILGLSGQYRLFARNYRIEGRRLVTTGVIAPPNVHSSNAAFPWLLFSLMGFERDWDSRQVDAEIDRLLGEENAFTNLPLWERPPPRPLPPSLANPPRAKASPMAPPDVPATETVAAEQDPYP